MADSVGAAAARGIESGFGLGQRLYEAEDRKKERELQMADRQEDRAFQREERGLRMEGLRDQRARQARDDARQERQDAVGDIDAQLRFADQDLDGLKNEYAAYLQAAGNDPSKIDPNTLADWNARFKDISTKRGDLRTQRFAPFIEKQAAKAADTASRLATGQVSIDEVSDTDLHDAVQFQTRRPVDDFISGDGIKPSAVRQGIMDFEAGHETGNEGLMMRGLNVIFKPELMTGIGQQAHDGSEIIDKEIYALAPHPDESRAAQGFVVPILEVTVRRPDGAIGKYKAPVTTDRSSYFGNQSAMPMELNIKNGFDRIGQLGQLEATLNQPGLKERVLKGREEAGTDNDEAFKHFARMGGKLEKRKIKRDTTDLGDRVRTDVIDDATGEVKSTSYERKGKLPGAGAKDATETSAKERLIDRQLRQGLITEQEAKEARRALVLGKETGSDSKPLNEGQDKAYQFGQRMRKAQDVILKLEEGGTHRTSDVQRGAESLPLVGGLAGIAAKAAFSSAEEQRFDQAQRQFINAVLRRESGAVISKEEFENARRQYFPEIGDDDDAIEQKRQAREDAIEFMVEGLPTHYKQKVIAAAQATDPKADTPQRKSGRVEAEPAKPKSKAEFDKLPSGTLFIAPDGSTRRKP